MQAIGVNVSGYLGIFIVTGVIIVAHDSNRNTYEAMRSMKKDNPTLFTMLDDYSRKYQFPKAKDTGSAAKLVAALFLYSIFTGDTI